MNISETFQNNYIGRKAVGSIPDEVTGFLPIYLILPAAL
jgi:hypothetical protein